MRVCHAPRVDVRQHRELGPPAGQRLHDVGPDAHVHPREAFLAGRLPVLLCAVHHHLAPALERLVVDPRHEVAAPRAPRRRVGHLRGLVEPLEVPYLLAVLVVLVHARVVGKQAIHLAQGGVEDGAGLDRRKLRRPSEPLPGDRCVGWQIFPPHLDPVLVRHGLPPGVARYREGGRRELLVDPRGVPRRGSDTEMPPKGGASCERLPHASTASLAIRRHVTGQWGLLTKALSLAARSTAL
mmetsp:Transcript_45706/g.114550  ORF Transcript_45706/g.114550 Transcript_45706/m.114550 type:complete len:240 (+) Transcript_45706:105-824(+)